MESSIADEMYTRFFVELEESGVEGKALSRALQALYEEGTLQREAALIDLYARLAEEGS